MSYYNQLLYEAGGGIVNTRQLAERGEGASIIIGIGGTGCDALRKLKQEVYSSLKPDDPESLITTYKGIQFLAIDSDRFQFQSAKNFKDLDVNTEFFDISNDHNAVIFGMKGVLKKRKELEWLSEDIPDISASNGTRGIRQVGRFLLIDKAASFEAKLKSIVMNAITGNTGDIMVHIISGLSGGTGSGCFIDVCYLVRKVLHDLGKDNAMILGYFFLPDVNLSRSEIARDPFFSIHIRQNGYAALKELDYLMNMRDTHECFEQDYGSFNICSKEAPVDVCYLVSATDSSGIRLENGYNFCTSMVADYILSKLAEKDNQRVNFIEDIMLAKMEFLEKMEIKSCKKYGAFYGYNIMGISSVKVPSNDICTYLASRVFKEFHGIYEKTPSEEELDKFVVSNHLSYESIESELTQGVHFSIEFPDFIPPLGNALVVKVCDQWKAVSCEKFRVNRKVLLEELEKDYRVAENPRSLIGKLYRALYEKSVDEDFGPFYAKRMLYSKENKNFINVIDGYRKRVFEEKEFEARQEPLLRDELDAAEASFKGARSWLPTLLPGSVKNTYKKYLYQLERWYLHLGKLEELNELENLFRELEKQAIALYQNYFDTLTVVMETLRDTFERNYRVLQEECFGDNGRKSYTWDVITVPEIAGNLEQNVAQRNCKAVLREFLQMMNQNTQMWITWDKTKMCQMITEFMNHLFQEQNGKTIVDYLKEKFHVTDGMLLTITINEILEKMDETLYPLFFTHPWFDMNSVVKQCIISIPYDLPEIEVAAQTYISGKLEYRLQKTGFSDRIVMTKIYTGVPLFAYQPLAWMEKEYENGVHVPGIHLYENGKVNWKETLPSPIPDSYR